MPLERKILTSANDIDLIKLCSLLDACLLFRFIPWHPEPFLLKLMNQNKYQAHLGIFSHISGLVLQKQASQTRITYYITQILCDIITCLCPRYLLHSSSYTYIYMHMIPQPCPCEFAELPSKTGRWLTFGFIRKGTKWCGYSRVC